MFKVPHTQKEIYEASNAPMRSKMHRENSEFYFRWFTFCTAAAVVGLFIAIFAMLVKEITG